MVRKIEVEELGKDKTGCSWIIKRKDKTVHSTGTYFEFWASRTYSKYKHRILIPQAKALVKLELDNSAKLGLVEVSQHLRKLNVGSMLLIYIEIYMAKQGAVRILAEISR